MFDAVAAAPLLTVLTSPSIHSPPRAIETPTSSLPYGTPSAMTMSWLVALVFWRATRIASSASNPTPGRTMVSYDSSSIGT